MNLNFLPQNSRTRKTALIVIGTGLLLFTFSFVYIYYFSEPDSVSDAGREISAAITEQAVKKIDRDITAIEKELQDDFYKTLRRRTWTPDKAAAGNKNPFAK